MANGQPGQGLSRPLLLVMASACGLTCANIYYNQPLLDQIKDSLGTDVAAVGWIPALTQVGYALGMVFLVPLGDKLERKRLVLLFSLLSAVCLAAFAAAPTLWTAAVASLCLGFTTMTPQLLIPFGAQLAAPEQRGKVIGTMMSGLLLGILLARTVSGFVGAAAGWRMMFAIAAAAMVVLAGIMQWLLPRSTPSYHGNYSGLLQSVVNIFKEQPALREACLFGAMLFGSFSAFWATLIHLMETPAFNYGSRSVGLFGLLGACAALTTPVIGSMTDRREPRSTTGLMLAVVFASFLMMAFSSTSLIGLIVGVVVMDIGVQAGHVSNQSRIFRLVPEAHSRVQTAYMSTYFFGGALGSLLGTWAWSHYGWGGVCGTAMLLLAAAGVRFCWPRR